MSIKEALATLYTGRCTIYGYVNTVENGVTEQKEVVLHSALPCRLSFKTIEANNQTPTVGEVQQLVKLFLSPDIEIKPGSKIIVTQNGVTTTYWHSGKSAMYSSHQEVILRLEQEWS